MLYGSIDSTATFRFLRYFSSILYGCRAPVVSSNMMTRTGPLVLSGLAAGVSVDGPIASVSARVNSAGGAALAEVDGAIWAISVDSGSTVEWLVVSIGSVSAGFDGIASAGAAAAAGGSGLSSTGVDDKASWLLGGCADVGAGCGVLAAAVATGWSVDEAMAGGDCLRNKCNGERLRRAKRMSMMEWKQAKGINAGRRERERSAGRGSAGTRWCGG